MAGLYLPLLITSGEPAGIGMDIILSLAASNRLTNKGRGVVVLADLQAL